VRHSLTLAALPLCLALAACQKTPAPTPAAAPAFTPGVVDNARLVNADQDTANWVTVGRTYSEQRHSPLDKINTETVKQLGLAWYLDLDTHRGQEATPLVVDGVMYSTSAWSKVQAIDAATGKLLWQYDPKVPQEIGVKVCCDTVNRGVAFWQGRVYLGALDGRLIALDAKTGTEVWSVVTVDQTKGYASTGAPRIIKGKVILGSAGAEFDARGSVSAYDADTGKMLWRFYTVPGDPKQPFEQPILEQAAKTWTGEWWKLGGGGTVWNAISYDPALDMIYFGTGNGLPWSGTIRNPKANDNLFLASIVAVKAETGEYVWHYQTTPGDIWDYDSTQDIILAELKIDGQMRQVLMQAAKNGFFYVIDRTNGKLISAQPFGMVNWATSIDMSTGKPNENPDARKTADPTKPWIAMPGALGSHNWQSMAFSPQTGYAYIPANDIGMVYADSSAFKPAPLGFNTGYDNGPGSMPQGDAKVKESVLAGIHGYLRAWDPIAQKEVWSVEHPGPWNGGVLSTGGGLVFQGNAVGLFNAYNAKDGKLLWSAPTQTGVIAAPMTYTINGEQFIAIVVGWGGVYPLTAGELNKKGSLGVNRSRVLAFKIGGDVKLPEPAGAAEIKPAPRVGNDTMAQRGFTVFHTYCMVCHGDAAVGGGVLPDLRWSPMARDGAAWRTIVVGGALKEHGMVSFARVLTNDDVEALRAYVTKRSQDSWKEMQAAKKR
jgi:alcohol dehydrogenase (cytochrome c)/quinohemoprotein ethanol dehydrogenase